MSRSKVRHYAAIGAVAVVCTGVMVGTLFNQDAKSKAMAELAEGVKLISETGDFTAGMAHIQKAKALHEGVISKMMNDSQWQGDSHLVERTIFFPRDLEGKERLVKQYVDDKKFDNAHKLAQDIISWQCGDFSSKEPAYAASQRDNSSRPPLSRTFAEILIEQGKNDEAITQLERTVALFPYDYFRDRHPYENVKENAKGQKAHLLKIAKAGEEYDLRTVGDLISQSSDAYYPTDYATPPVEVRRLNDFLKVHPNCAPVLLARARILVKGGHYDSGTIDANKVLKMFPGLAEALAIRAEAYMQQRKYELALKDLDEALKQIPNSVAILREKATLFKFIGRYDDAAMMYKQVLSVCPWHSETRKDLTLLLCALGRKEDAEKVVDSTLQYRSLDEVCAHRYSAYVSYDYHSFISAETEASDIHTLYYGGKLTEAKKAIEDYFKQHGSNREIDELKIRIALEQGNAKEALELLSKGSLSNETSEDELLCLAYKGANDPKFDEALKTGFEHAKMQENTHSTFEMGCIREAALHAKFDPDSKDAQPSKALAPLHSHFKHANKGMNEFLILAADLRRMGKGQLADEILQAPLARHNDSKKKSQEPQNSTQD